MWTLLGPLGDPDGMERCREQVRPDAPHPELRTLYFALLKLLTRNLQSIQPWLVKATFYQYRKKGL